MHHSEIYLFQMAPRIKANTFYKPVGVASYLLLARIQKGRRGVWAPLKNHKNIGFLSNTGPDPLKNHKAIKPDSMLGHQRHASWQADAGPLIVIFGSSLPSSTKKKQNKKLFPSCTPSDKSSGSAHVLAPLMDL